MIFSTFSKIFTKKMTSIVKFATSIWAHPQSLQNSCSVKINSYDTKMMLNAVYFLYTNVYLSKISISPWQNYLGHLPFTRKGKVGCEALSYLSNLAEQRLRKKVVGPWALRAHLAEGMIMSASHHCTNYWQCAARLETRRNTNGKCLGNRTHPRDASTHEATIKQHIAIITKQCIFVRR